MGFDPSLSSPARIETFSRHCILVLRSNINTLCMKMTAKFRTKNGLKNRKLVLREMKKLNKRIGKHARNHLRLLAERGHQTDLAPGHIRTIPSPVGVIGWVAGQGGPSSWLPSPS